MSPGAPHSDGALRIDGSLQLGDLHLAVDFVAPAGEVTVVVGPNGAGKTTLLRVLAGTVALDAGSLAVGEDVLDRPPGRFVPPERRRAGVVDQDHLLFAHLSALDNVAFGPRCAGRRVGEARRVAREWLGRLGVDDVAHLRPAALSGGQAQRVALARALAVDPAVLLLDEPLAALDAATRSDVRRDLRQHLRSLRGPTVFVTHDPVDALTLADHLVVLEGGRVTQSGPLADVTVRPRSRYLAEFLGVNLVAGVVDSGLLRLEGGPVLRLAGAPAGVPGVPAGSKGVAVWATVPPAALTLTVPGRDDDAPVEGSTGDGGTEGGVWPATVEHLDVAGDRVRVVLAGPPGFTAVVTPAEVARLGLAEGCTVGVGIDAEQVTAYAV